MQKIILSIAAVLLFLTSCTKETLLPYENSPLIGQWEGIKLVQKVNSTVNYCDSYSVAFTFAPDGTGLYYGLNMTWQLDTEGPDGLEKITVLIKNNPFFTATIQNSDPDTQEWVIMESNSVFDLIKTSFHMSKKGISASEIPHGG
ncbi:MAG: hypothetical protein KDC59_10315 [Saprospiraceae bacterium]|nr:hypothetical protein [Saprospiraceae bacterium]